MHRVVFAGLLVLGAMSSAHAAPDCSSSNLVQQPLPSRPLLTAPVAAEFSTLGGRLGAPRGVLAHEFDESQSVDRVLLRMRIAHCKNVAVAVPATVAVNANDPAGYKPKTEFDNTPYRFNMTQNGKRMTADDFDAWLQANGYSAGRRAETPAPAAAAPAND